MTAGFASSSDHNPGAGSSEGHRWPWCLGIALAIGLTLGFRWVNFTLDRDLNGFAFSLSSYSPSHPAVIFGSFGIVASIILLAAGIAVFFNKPNCQGLLGALLLAVMFWGYLQIAVGDSGLLLALARQSDWWLIIAGHPPPVARIEPGVWPQLGFDTLMERLFSAWYYLGIGWYVGVVAGILLMCSAIASGRTTHWRLLFSAPVTCFALLATAFLCKPILAERILVSAVNSDAKGEFLRAKREYRKAMEFDRWYALNPQLYERIGRSDEALGHTQSPEYALYRDEMIFENNQNPASIWQLELVLRDYDRVARMSGPIAEVAALRSVEMRVFYGLHLFQSGSFGSAVIMWNDALRREPNNWLAAYYLTLGYPSVGRYSDLETMSKRFLRRCGDPLSTGVFFDSLGKAQIYLGDSNAGHVSYFTSYKMDYINNNAAIRSLIGP